MSPQGVKPDGKLNAATVRFQNAQISERRWPEVDFTLTKMEPTRALFAKETVIQDPSVRLRVVDWRITIFWTR